METIFTQATKSKEEKHGSPLVLVHGSWGSSPMWQSYVEFLSAEGWNTYAPDLRGHGKSGGNLKGATMEDYVADVHQSVSENNLEDPILFGHSMGGLVVLMYAAMHGARAVVSIDPSPSKEVQETESQITYPEEYSAVDAGMPADPKAVMGAFPDILPEKLMKIKDMLGMESGAARSDRKRGVSIPKEKLSMPVLFVGGEHGKSVTFGIGIETARAMAEYYGKDVLEVKGATHPGILMGTHAKEAVESIEAWLKKQ